MRRSTGRTPTRTSTVLASAESTIRRSVPTPDVLLGLVIVALSLSPLMTTRYLFGVPNPVALVLGFAAVALRRRPVLSAMATLLLAILQPFPGDGLTPIASVYVVVAFSLSLHGTPVLRVASGVGAVLGGAYAAYLFTLGGGRLVTGIRDDAAVQWPTLVAPTAVLLGAWLIGLTVRLRRSNRSETALRFQAQRRAVAATESARTDRLRAEMARDVHDVVGHSLAVIIAQADAAGFSDDPDDLHRITRNIAAAARSSLGEVRDVLAGIDAEPDPEDAIGLTEAVEQLRGTGLAVEHTVRGRRGRLGQGERTAARRILQEMVANVLRHGDAGEPVRVLETWWPDAVVIEVQNSASADGAEPGSQRGLVNMAHRARAVGGAFETTTTDGRFVGRVRLPAGELLEEVPR